VREDAVSGINVTTINGVTQLGSGDSEVIVNKPENRSCVSIGCASLRLCHSGPLLARFPAPRSRDS
jgi:hypothetical protein